MVNQTSLFGGMLTTLGAVKKTNCDALGIPWQPSHMLIGDAGGADPVPAPGQTRLINQVYRAPLNQLYVSPTDPNVLVAELVLPPSVGGWWIRELALEDADGVFSAVANCAPSYKPLLAQGSGRNQVVRMHIVTSGMDNIQLKIDPSVVLATRDYVDTSIIAALNKQDFKHSVVVATTANIALTGLRTVDGVPLAAGSRVLVKDQTAAKDNGIYVVAAGAWVRAADADASVEVTPGLFVHVEQGAVRADTVWQLVTEAPVILGTTPLAFEMIAGPTGITAGTYTRLTVDRNGRVMAGTSPATAAGLGIADVYTKTEVDDLFSRSDVKGSVAVATTGNIALSGLQTIDGVALVAGSRVLVKNQTNAAHNWIYVVAAGAWVRAQDANESAECTPGHLVLVQAGTVNAGSVWQLSNTAPPVLGTTALNFTLLIGKTGVAAGTYRQVAVDALGRVIGGSNPTTLLGYGIIDAYTKVQIDQSLAIKANSATTLAGYGIMDAYTKTEANNQLNGKADKATTLGGYGIGDAYTKTQIDTALALKAPLANAALTGKPTAPTAAINTNNLELANTAFVKRAIDSVINGAPGALDTLIELSKALGDDPNFAATMANALAGKAGIATTLGGYGIVDAYTKTEANNQLNAKAAKATNLVGYGINDAYTKTQVDSLITTNKSPAASKTVAGVMKQSTEAQARAGTDDTTAMTPAMVSVAQTLFTSAPLPIVTGSQTVVTHGLGFVPDANNITITYVCVTSDTVNGYVAGDEVDFSNFRYISEGSLRVYGFSIHGRTATQLTLTSGIGALWTWGHKTTGQAANLVLANWRVVVRIKA